MDATTMRLTKSIVNKLSKDHPQFVFAEAKEFWWSADQQTVFYNPASEHIKEFTLHELSHALLDHKGYKADIDLVKLERDAWEYAKNILAPKYDFVIDDDVIQDNLDTYRDWIHSRSKCPDCSSTGLQSGSNGYRCLACGNTWRVNEARLCALRRYSLATK